MKEITKKVLLTKWTLLVYTVFAVITSGIYIAFNSTFYQVDWQRYNSDYDYYKKIEAILPKGVLQMNGRVDQITSPFLVGIFLIGIALCLVLFISRWKTYYQRTYTPFLALFGFLLPLVVHNGDNILWMVLLGLLLALLGGAFYTAALWRNTF